MGVPPARVYLPDREVEQDLLGAPGDGRGPHHAIDALDDLALPFLDDAGAAKDLRGLAGAELQGLAGLNLQQGALAAEFLIGHTLRDLRSSPRPRRPSRTGRQHVPGCRAALERGVKSLAVSGKHVPSIWRAISASLKRMSW